MLFLITSTFTKLIIHTGMSWRTVGAPANDSGVVISIGYGYAKITPSGNVLWAKSTGLNWTQELLSYPGGYAAVFRNTDSYDMLISAFGEDGNPKWMKTVSLSSGSISSVANGIYDGEGFLFLFLVYFSDVGNYRPMLIKTDTLGNLLWAKRYDLGPNADAVISVGGKYFLLSTDASDTVVILAIRKNDGAPLWAKKMDFIRDYSYLSWGVMRLARIGPDFIFYHKKTDFVARFDTLGNVIWTRKLQYVNGWDMEVSGSDVYISAGVITVVKLDGNGNLLWARRYGYTPWFPSFYDIIPSGGYVYIYGDPDGAPDTSLLVKLNPVDGQAPCYENSSIPIKDSSFITRSITVNGQDVVVSLSTSGSVSNTTVSIAEGCLATSISERKKVSVCGSGVYDSSGRRLGRLPKEPGVYFIRTEDGWKKVVVR